MDEIRVLKGLISLSSRFGIKIHIYIYIYVYVQNIYIEMVYKVIPVTISHAGHQNRRKLSTFGTRQENNLYIYITNRLVDLTCGTLYMQPTR